MTEPFLGAKLAILVGDQIVVLLRDDIPTIAWPGHWDLPGGERDPGETPEETVLRELWEELGLRLSASDLIYKAEDRKRDLPVWFFVAEWPDFDPDTVTFGNEGQGWKLDSIDWYLNDPLAIPHHVSALKRYLATR